MLRVDRIRATASEAVPFQRVRKESFRGDREDGGSEDSNARTEKVRKVSDVCLEKEADISSRCGDEEPGGGGRRIASGGMKARRLLWRIGEEAKEARARKQAGRAGEGGNVGEKESIGIPRYRYANEEQGRRGRKKKAKWTPRKQRGEETLAVK